MGYKTQKWTLDMDLGRLGKIKRIHMEKISLGGSFLDFSSRFSSMTGTVILMSGGDLDCARYHIIGAKPWLSFVGRNENVHIVSKDHSFSLKKHPLEALRMLLAAYNFDHQTLPKQFMPPIMTGLFGYISYDLKDSIESLPRTSVDDLGLPHICLYAPSIVLIYDKKEDDTWLCIPERTQYGQSSLDEDRRYFSLIQSSAPPTEKPFSGDAGGFRSNFKKAIYMDAIKKIKNYIASGDVYQVNMSQRFEMDFEGDTFCLFKTLYKTNPAPFFAFINAGDHQVISTSPERFIQRIDRRVETRPIKGTMPRGNTPAEDKERGRELMKSEKDDAELSMIVDLLRNDFGKVCECGSVRVAEHKRLEAYQNVYHLVSIVEGILAENHDSVDLLTATFPGGSITGCPKIRSMEIIDELEPNRRHVYTGAIGYISFHDTMDLSIAIRTATVFQGKIFFSVGGGIVFDSDPSDEFDETLHKGKTLLEVFRCKSVASTDKGFVWMNGKIMPTEQASIPLTDLGVQYGYGFFETIRADKGQPSFLKEHMDRFNETWSQLFSTEPPDLTWDEIIKQVITANDLNGDTAAIKILTTRGNRDLPPFNHSFVVTARRYIPRLSNVNQTDTVGLDLVTYPMPRQTPLADHKTLNYLYYFLAGKWARNQGADEALIINPDGTVSETNTANIILIRDKAVMTPVSPHVLPGITERIICRLLVEWGYRLENRRLMPSDLLSGDELIITNSLIGALPVLNLDGERMSNASNLWQKVNAAIFEV